jgi:basic membrane lipoprotein Med (substrate-binding protein (PBP1-ABC) superfamily)
MKRKYIWIVLLLLLALLISACGGDEAEETPTEEPSTGQEAEQPEEAEEAEEPEEAMGPFRVAAIMPSATNDLAFSQSMFDALNSIQGEMGADNFEFVFSEGMFNVDDAAAAIRDYASEGFDLVIAHGSQYGASLQEIAPDFPETSFAWGTTVDTFGLDNIFAYEARSEQGGYVSGLIAASLSESGTLGVVGPIETGDAKLYVDGFVAGAKATNPDAVVNVNYIGSFSDVALASEAAQTHVNAGADGLTGSAQMVVGAIGVAEENDALWFGTQSSQTSLAPGIVVANQVYDWSVFLDEMIEMVKGGTLGGSSFVATLENGGLLMEYNPDFDLPDDVKALADATVAGIIDGSIVVGEAPPPAEEAEAEAPEPMEDLVFGMILVGPKNDRGWSQAHYEAGQYVEEQIPGAQMIVFDSMNPADKPEATVVGVVDDMVTEGATWIIATSDEFEEDFATAAEKYPEVIFTHASGDDAWLDGNDAGVAPPNEGNVMSRLVEMKAIAGCAAAMATETGEIGYLGPLINHETRRLAASAYLGARYCYENFRGLNPDDLEFNVVWIGFWFNIPGVTLDPTEVVNQFYDTGADVVISGIDTTEALDVTSRRAAQGDPILTVAYDYDKACDLAPEVCLGVPFFSWRPMYLEQAQSIVDGTWEQSFDWRDPYWDDLTDITRTGGGWISGPALEANEEWLSAVNEFIEKYASGEINVWEGPIVLQDGTVYIPAGSLANDLEIWYLPLLLEGMTGASE